MVERTPMNEKLPAQDLTPGFHKIKDLWIPIYLITHIIFCITLLLIYAPIVWTLPLVVLCLPVLFLLMKHLSVTSVQDESKHSVRPLKVTIFLNLLLWVGKIMVIVSAPLALVVAFLAFGALNTFKAGQALVREIGLKK